MESNANSIFPNLTEWEIENYVARAEKATSGGVTEKSRIGCASNAGPKGWTNRTSSEEKGGVGRIFEKIRGRESIVAESGSGERGHGIVPP